MSRYRMIAKAAVFAAAMLASIPAAGQTYYNIVNRLSGFALDNTNASKSAGTPMQQWPCDNQQQQNWMFTSSGSSTYTLQNQLSGLYLKAPSTANGAIITQGNSDSASDENWIISMNADGYETIENQYSQKVLDTSASTTEGTEIEQYTADNQQQQDWLLVPAGNCGTSYLSVTTNSNSYTGNTVSVEFPLPANAELTSLMGTVTLTNSSTSSSLMSEVLFVVGVAQSGSCLTSPPPGTTIVGSIPNNNGVWQYILKNPNAGSITVPISYLPPALPPLSNCLVMGMGGGPVDNGNTDTVSFTMHLSATWISGTSSSYVRGLGAEYIYNHGGGFLNTVNYGNTGGPYGPTTAFATVYPVTTTSTLNYLWGGISDSTFDTTVPYPTGSWTVSNNVYVYPTSACAQFQPNTTLCPKGGANGVLYCGPSTSFYPPPSNSYQLLNTPLSGSGVEAQNTGVYSLPYDEIVYASQCIVQLVEIPTATSGATANFDTESQIYLVLTPYN